MPLTPDSPVMLEWLERGRRRALIMKLHLAQMAAGFSPELRPQIFEIDPKLMVEADQLARAR